MSDDRELAIARRMVAPGTEFGDFLEAERAAFAAALGREPTREEFAEHARQRFRADLAVREQAIAALRRAEAEELAAWGAATFAPIEPAPEEGAA